MRGRWWVPATGGLAIVGSLAIVLAISPSKRLAVAESLPNGRREGDDPEWAIRNGRGKAFAAHGDAARALAEFNQAISSSPDHPVLYANRGGAKLQLGDRTGAIEDCSRAVDMDRRCVEGFVNRAQARKELGDWGRASEDYSRALELLRPSDMLWEPVRQRLEEAQRRAGGRDF